jgi:RND family efflux transporter MFP subunit
LLVSSPGSNAVAQAPRPETRRAAITRSFTQPIEQSVVSSGQMGVLQNALVKEGDRVLADETLAVIRHHSLEEERRIAVAKAESTARLEAAKAQLTMLTSQKETLEELVGGGHVNQYEVEQKRSEYENAVAEYKLAKDEIRLARLEVDRMDARVLEHTIKSPIDGFVTVIHKQPGEHISTNEPQYATVVRLDQLKARFYLDEQTANALAVGSQGKVRIGSETEPRIARVIYVSPIIDPDSGTARIEVAIDNEDLKIRSGAVCYWLSIHRENQRPQLTKKPVGKKLTLAEPLSAKKTMRSSRNNASSGVALEPPRDLTRIPATLPRMKATIEPQAKAAAPIPHTQKINRLLDRSTPRRPRVASKPITVHFE